MCKIDNNICVSIGNMNFKECIDVLKISSLTEIRFDLLNLSNDEYEIIFNQDCEIIATYRPCNTDELSRKETLIKAIDNGAKYIDLEFDAPDDYFSTIYKKVKNSNTKIIISYHNYKITPKLKELQSIIDSCKNKGGDIIKIACQVNTNSDLLRLLNLYDKHENIIIIGMGKKGILSRIAAISLGSPFTYAAADSKHKTAPGQLTIRDYEQIKDMYL